MSINHNTADERAAEEPSIPYLHFPAKKLLPQVEMDLSWSPQKSKPRCEFASPEMSFEMVDQHQQPNWSDLPPLILSCIMEKLPWEEDYVRFGAICVPWRTVFLSGSANTHSSPPFLLIPPFVAPQNNRKPKSNKRKRNFEDLFEMRSLYSIARNKVCDFKVRVAHSRYYVVGSSLGWLLTMKPKKYGVRKVKYYVQLENPFLPNADHIHLPHLPFHNILAEEVPFMYIHKAVLSSPPDNNLNKNFILMAIMSRDYKLAFFNPSTKNFCWTPVGDWEDSDKNDDNYERMAFSDVLYFSGTQQFYAVHQDTGAVYAVDIEGLEKHRSLVPKLTLVAPPTDRWDSVTNRYIVELPSGDLLQLIKFLELVTRSIPHCVWRRKIEVLKFDSDIGDWVQIHDIGDAMLFIGGNSSISRYASDFPYCKPNCIYFTDESESHFHHGFSYRPEDMGIYSLEDESIQPHYSMGLNRSLTAPIWLEPTSKK